MHFLSSPCHKSLLKGVICLHEKLQLNPFIFTFFFSFPTFLSFYLYSGSSWKKCLYLLSDRDMTYNFRCWKSRIFSSNCISYLSMKRKCRQGKHSKSSSDFKKIKSPNANQWDAGNDACQTFKRFPLRETNPLFLLWKMLRSTCRAVILIFASGSLALIHCLLTSTFWWQPWHKCSWQVSCFH